MKKILLIEDDGALIVGIEGALKNEQYEVRVARSGHEGFRMAQSWKPDLILLDIMLPGMSGFEICKRLREMRIETPIIILTAKSEEDDRVLGLELGADDYVTKPFSLRELLARVKAQFRRDRRDTRQKIKTLSKVTFGNVTVDFKRLEVYKNNELQDLTRREFRLLEYFIQHPGEVLSRDRLLDEIWGYEVYPTTRTIDNHVLRLRKHIEADPENPQYIKTIHGVGYMFEAPHLEFHD